ncbi:MAG: cation:proton antiporter [Candidatus Aminicenantales bacterium]
MDIPILRELIIVLAASIVISLLSHRLRLPAVVGFLLTGILIGPSGLRIIKATEPIDVLAEIGVVMLLFTIGIEFSLGRLKQIKKSFFLGGGLQILLTTAGAVIFLQLFHFPISESIFYGFLISLSSTAVVLKIYSDRAETDSPHGNIALGILLFQDIGLVPMIALVPVLGRDSSVSLGIVSERFLLSFAVIAAVFLAARLIMPRVLYFIVKTRIREVFVIAALFICVSTALLTASLGLSLALGAFIAGIIISESEYSHQVVSDIIPFKSLFNSLFFISIGMLLNLEFVWAEKFFILVLVLSIFLLKSLVLFVVVRFLRYPAKTALLVALSLAQIGEFSFVLANVGRINGLLPEKIFQAFIAASILTILATPFLIQLAPRLAEKSKRMFKKVPRAENEGAGLSKDLNGHVIIAGYGLNGHNLSQVLKETGIPYVILELNPDTVKACQQDGEPILFGDVSSREVLNAAGIEKAKAIVFAISDPQATRRGVQAARGMNSALHIIVRTRFISEIDELYKLGADQVIPEEFETSVEIFTRTLEEYHVPRNLIDAQIKIIRSETYGMLRGVSKTPRSLEKISEFLAAGTAETFYVTAESVAAGKNLNALDLRKETGATIIAIVRDEKTFASPGPDFRIQEGDILVLVANHRDMDRAFQFLG